ncbi:MAG TPA: 2-oxoacid:acceptor oxidoreductase subunit alpha [Alphaproteobacteria bacterium]|nr:2-oxoacid:acceptor oxidoreductase subunit alpha [Alphaproteobacteria bacterium]
MAQSSISLALAGSGGAGAMTAGALLLEGAARAGYYGLFTRLVGGQVRGGEAASLLRLAPAPVDGMDDAFHLLCAIDWHNVDRFAAEIPLAPNAFILADPDMGPVPAKMTPPGARVLQVPLQALAAKIPRGRANMVALGLLAAILGIPLEHLLAALPRRLTDYGPAALEAGRQGVEAGYAQRASLDLDLRLPPAAPVSGRWVITGNEALGLGALRGGVRFVAGYPITPATEIVEWLAPALQRLGGQVILGEDELASINLALGASYGGVPAMTVTSGPGFSLMTETLGLGIATELPLVLIDVMRAGPSTGIATKTEQSDLNHAVLGGHGDAPRIVLAPTSVADGIATTEWAVGLSESLQTPVIVLGDQFMGQAQAVIDAPPARASSPVARRVSADASTPKPYKRYALTPSGVSPVSAPGAAGLAWVGDGLTHDETGHPVSGAKDHIAQMEKRARKLEAHDFGARWADLEGDGALAFVTWGSSGAAVREAAARLRLMGVAVRTIVLRVIAPVQLASLEAALAGVERVLVVELNHRGQLLHLLRGAGAFGGIAVESLARPGPKPFSPDEIVARAERRRAA